MSNTLGNREMEHQIGYVEHNPMEQSTIMHFYEIVWVLFSVFFLYIWYIFIVANSGEVCWTQYESHGHFRSRFSLGQSLYLGDVSGKIKLNHNTD